MEVQRVQQLDGGARRVRGHVRRHVDQRARVVEDDADAGAGARGRNNQGGGRGRVYVLEAGKLKPLNVRLGISDGSSTEVVKILEGDLQEGQEVVIGLAPKSKDGKKPTRSPF